MRWAGSPTWGTLQGVVLESISKFLTMISLQIEVCSVNFFPAAIMAAVFGDNCSGNREWKREK